MVHDALSGEHQQWIADLVKKCARLGYVDDAAYAQMRARSLFARGKPSRSITQDLIHKGLSPVTIKVALAGLEASEEGDIDKAAVIRMAKRRRFGPFQPDPDRAKPRDKQIAAIMRAGFRYALAAWVVDANSVEDLTDEL